MKSLLAAAALVSATLVSAPAAQAVVTLDCSTGPVEISGSNETYALTGACSKVVVRGSGLRVLVPSATRLNVRGSSTSIVLAGPLGTADVRGSGLVVKGTKATSLKLVGSSAKITFTKLAVLRIKGADNVATVKKGTTEVSVTGAGNDIRVNQAA